MMAAWASALRLPGVNLPSPTSSSLSSSLPSSPPSSPSSSLRLRRCQNLAGGRDSVGACPSCRRQKLGFWRCVRSPTSPLRRLGNHRHRMLTAAATVDDDGRNGSSSNDGSNSSVSKLRWILGGELVDGSDASDGIFGGRGGLYRSGRIGGAEKIADGGGWGERTVRVRFCVSFRCHSRQVLCVGGSQFPFGWSFVSIAKIPMTWNPNDIWTAEVELPVGLRLEYKYVILEEQVWTKQEDGDSEGVVDITYRSGNEPGQPPDVQTIRKQMAIVDWQPGPNRVLQVPTKDELSRLQPGDIVRRTPAQPKPLFVGDNLEVFKSSQSEKEPQEANTTSWEELVIDEDGTAILTRQDVWPYTGNRFAG